MGQTIHTREPKFGGFAPPLRARFRDAHPVNWFPGRILEIAWAGAWPHVREPTPQVHTYSQTQ